MSVLVDPYQGCSEDGQVHSYPVGDCYPHRMHAKCWCRPVEDEEADGPLKHLVHNPFYERGTNMWQ